MATSSAPARSAPLDDYALEDQIGYAVRRAHQRCSDVFAKVMVAFDVTPVQFATMVRLAERGEVTRGELRKLVGLDPATAVGVVRRLRERGLVVQRADPHDARRLLIALTSAGEALVADMLDVAPDVSRATLEPLTPAERTQLLTLLTKLAAP